MYCTYKRTFANRISKQKYPLDNEYGITLISLDEAYREKMEPAAAPYTERLEAMEVLSEAGCRTWVNMEPYPTPNLFEQELQNLLEAVSFTDRIIFVQRETLIITLRKKRLQNKLGWKYLYW